DLVSSRIHVPDRGPPVVASPTREAPPQRKRNLDAVLEHEGRTRFEHRDRDEDEPERDETEPAERPQSFRARRDGSDSECHREDAEEDGDRTRVRGGRAAGG